MSDLSDFGVFDVTGLGITLLTHNSMQQLEFRALERHRTTPSLTRLISLDRLPLSIIMYGQLMAQFTSSRPSIKREPNMMKLEGGERKVLKSLTDLQGDSTDYVDDSRLAVAAKMFVQDVRDCLES